MAVQESTTVNASVERVVETLASEEFARFVCDKLGIGYESFNVSGALTDGFVITTGRSVSADKVPDIAKKFVSKGIQMTQTDTVSAPAGDGGRSINTEIKVAGMPVTAKASQNLVPQGEQTVINVSGEVSCGIPLVGKKIAASAEPYVGRVLARLGQLVEEWVSSH